MRRLFTIFALALVASAFGANAAPASAARCSDFPNQAAAQRAHNTRDADHDGIYCESLPCPCLGKGGGGGKKPSSGGGRVNPGRSILLAARTLGTGCRIRGGLPDPRCTPGAYFSRAGRSMICVRGYTAKVRNVTSSMKARVYAEYGIRHHSRGQYEVDHLVPLEGGGSNSIANLFPEAANPRPGFHQKDKLENEMHRRICNGTASIRRTQRVIARNWLSLYRRWF